jgi:hypothetical protein
MYTNARLCRRFLVWFACKYRLNCRLVRNNAALINSAVCVDGCYFLPSADSKAACRRPWKHFLTHPLDFIEIGCSKAFCDTLDDQWHITMTFVTCVTHVTSVTHGMCHTVTQCDTLSAKKLKCKKIQKSDNWEITDIRNNVTLHNTLTLMWHQVSF